MLVQKAEFSLLVMSMSAIKSDVHGCISMQAVWNGLHLWNLSDWQLAGFTLYASGGCLAFSATVDLCRIWYRQWLSGPYAPRDAQHTSAWTRGRHRGRKVNKKYFLSYCTYIIRSKQYFKNRDVWSKVVILKCFSGLFFFCRHRLDDREDKAKTELIQINQEGAAHQECSNLPLQ